MAERPFGLAPPGMSRRAAAGAMRRVLVQPGHNSFPDMTAFIVGHFGFELLQLGDYESHRAQSKWTHLCGLARQTLQLLAALPRLRRSRCVLTIGPVSHGHLFKILRALRLVRGGRSIALGWYIHTRRLFPLLRLLTRLDGADDHYIFFSEWEIALYREHLGIDPARMHCLPYGEWGPPPAAAESALPPDLARGGYYFAGGYSNRDYRGLVEAFRHVAAPLVIVCSAHNSDIEEIELPGNIRVLRDVPNEVFEAYVRHAKACIIPLKRDTGASGQSVTLRAMRNGKPVIASDFGGVRGYVVDGVCGFLVQDMARDLPAAIGEIERDPALAARMGEAAYRRYCEHFSPAAGAAALTRILMPLLD